MYSPTILTNLVPAQTHMPVPDTRHEESLPRWLAILLALLPATAYIAISWLSAANSPQSDDYPQFFFTVMQHQQAQTLMEHLRALHWNYFQHNGVSFKLVALAMYQLSGQVDLHLANLLGNLSLPLVTGLLAYHVYRQGLPLYSIAVASLLICSLYPWTTITWPACPLFYFGTVALSFACFHLLDLPRPRPVAAAICSWLAVFTMANGILSIPIAGLLVGYRQYTEKKFSRSTLAFLAGSTALCLLVYANTFNLFDSSVYGAKTLEQSFVNVGGRLVDFLESLGSVPFFPNEYRHGKIALGSIMLLLVCTLLLSRAARLLPAVTGLLLFNLGTVFLTSLFRYSSGGNDGYQGFVTMLFACTFVLAAAEWQSGHRALPGVMLVMAIAVNANALQHNLPLMQAHNEQKTRHLATYLSLAELQPEDRIFGPILREAIERDIYRPLQNHHGLPIVRSQTAAGSCPVASTVTALDSRSTEEAFAIELAFRTVTKQPASLWLCGTQHYQLGFDATGTAQTLLLDKRQFAPGEYRVLLEQEGAITALGQTVQIAPPGPYMQREADCKEMQNLTRYRSVQPLYDYFCRR